MSKRPLHAVADPDIERARANDEKNRRILSIAPWFLVTAYQRKWLLMDATAAERQEAVTTSNRRMMVIVAIASAGFALSYLIPREPRPAQAGPAVSEAGTVTSVQLHETTFSRSTTVQTSSGTFQVRGAVSASVGDKAQLKTEELPGMEPRRTLCVESAIKTACYDVL